MGAVSSLWPAGHCQSNLTPPRQSCIRGSSDRQLSPFSKRRIAALPEVGPTGEMAIKVELIMDGSMNGGELLKRGTASETLHGSLSSSERLMGIFRPVVQPSRGVLAASHAEARECRAAGTQAVGDDGAW